MQAVDGLPGAGQPLAHRRGNKRDPGLGTEQAARRSGLKPHAPRGLVGPDREGRRHAGQQRRVTEALARLEHLDHLALVDQLHRAGEDHPQSGGRLAVLHQHHLAGPQLAFDGGGDELPELVGVEAVEGRVPSQECVQVLHVGPRNCVRIAPLCATSDVSG